MLNEKTKYKNLKVSIDDKLTPNKNWIFLDTDPILRKKCEVVESLDSNDLEIINKMVSYIDHCYNGNYSKFNIRPGLAVAAPQMGLAKRIIYVHLNSDDREYRYLLANPEIISKSQVLSYVENGEGCLSVPKDIQCNIPRNYKIIVKAIDLFSGEEIEITAIELLSICLQHEIDHLDGILYTDRINKEKPKYINPNWFVVK